MCIAPTFIYTAPAMLISGLGWCLGIAFALLPTTTVSLFNFSMRFYENPCLALNPGVDSVFLSIIGLLS